MSLPAVTDMMRRLHEAGSSTTSPKGHLTDKGRQRLSRRQAASLWERFLTDILGLKWDKVHEEACRLEHATSLQRR